LLSSVKHGASEFSSPEALFPEAVFPLRGRHALPITLVLSRGRSKTLHLNFAFFLTSPSWFTLAPTATTVKEDLGLLAVPRIRTLAICQCGSHGASPAVLIGEWCSISTEPRITPITLLYFQLHFLACYLQRRRIQIKSGIARLFFRPLLGARLGSESAWG